MICGHDGSVMQTIPQVQSVKHVPHVAHVPRQAVWSQVPPQLAPQVSQVTAEQATMVQSGYPFRGINVKCFFTHPIFFAFPFPGVQEKMSWGV